MQAATVVVEVTLVLIVRFKVAVESQPWYEPFGKNAV